MPQPLWITATGTELGKSHTMAWLLKDWASKGVIAWKPVQSGTQPNGLTDSEWIESISGCRVANTRTIPDPIPPHLALEDHHSTLQTLTQQGLDFMSRAPLVIEGAGGVLSPLTRSIVQADWIKEFKPKVLLVGDPKLGGIHATLAALEALKSRNLECIGFLFSLPETIHSADNALTIASLSQIDFLGQIPRFPWCPDSQTHALGLAHSQEILERWQNIQKS